MGNKGETPISFTRWPTLQFTQKGDNQDITRNHLKKLTITVILSVLTDRWKVKPFATTKRNTLPNEPKAQWSYISM